MRSDPIQHVIVLMFENRSFDHMLGAIAGDLGFDGLDDANPPSNVDREGVTYSQARGASLTVRNDPKHDLLDVLNQLGNGGQNAGFVKDYEKAYPGSSHQDRQEIMLCHTDLVALHDLARDFMVCDRWFASVPGPTWPNRFFAHSGTSLGHVLMPDGIFDPNLHWYDQTTIYDRLNEANKPWRIYYGDIPQSLLLIHQLAPQNVANYWPMSSFFEDVAGDPSQFPAYSFIEPTYYGSGANDDHPTHNVMGGEQLLAQVYNALRANEALWASSLLVVLFDEHGGFYDHVSPPPATPPDDNVSEFAFNRFGVRIPSLLISPYVALGHDSTVFDHTSVLRYLADKWELGPLGDRTANANSIGKLIGTELRTDTIRALGPAGPLPTPEAPPTPTPELNSHQSALLAVAKLVEAAEGVAFSDLKSAIGNTEMKLDGDADSAVASVEAFLSRARAGSD